MNDDRIDELRQQLKSLGYLDAGVDRFVLGGARQTRGPVGTALRTSGRVGLLGGVLLGPAAALGLGARLPGLVGGVRDAVVIALYLAVIFAIAAAAAAFVISVAAAAARARQAPRLAAWIFTAGSLLYLTLWWRNANAGFGWSALVWTAFALAVAVAISLLLGHAVRIATTAVLATRGGAGPLPPVTSRSWRVVIGGGALAFGGAAALLLVTVRSDTEPPAPTPALTVVGSRAPIRLIAIDGFDYPTYQRLRDRLPNLRAALGGAQVTLQPQDTSDPARAWTTIATGVTAGIHGVHAIETRRIAGLSGALATGGRLHAVGIATDLLRLTRPSLSGAQDRRVKTMWEVAEQAGLRTAVINWWATWPAPLNGGDMITDRGVLRLEHGGPLDGEIGPAGLYDALRAVWPQLRDHASASAARAFSGMGDAAVASTLKRSAELDAALVALLRSLPPPRRDLDVIYLPGLDIAQSSLLAASTASSASSAAERVDGLERYYAFLDGVIAPLLDENDPTTVLVITQPGRVPASAGGVFAVWPRDKDLPARNNSAGDVVPLRMSPRNVARPVAPSATDVAPTVLYALGLPLSRELSGTALPELFEPSIHDIDRFVQTYGRPSVRTALTAGKPLDQEMIDRLRSLGYIR